LANLSEIEKDIPGRIEAALYASGKALDADQLAKAAGISSRRRAITEARAIAKAVNHSLHAVEVVEYPGPRFAMQLKREFTSVARKFATKPLLSRGALKTLSYVAYYQPISSRELAQRRGPQAYMHIRELEDLDFIQGERSGRVRVFKTTSDFSEYFGLSVDPPVLKKQLESRNLTLH
jgi:segregation and condensation protein B